MDESEKERWIKAGRIGKEVREYAVSIVKPGMALLDLARNIESKFAQLGSKLAFPPNLSINDTAAHYSPGFDDQIILKEGDMLKIDIGASVDGCLSDTAATVVVGEDPSPLVNASREALENVIKIMKPGMSIDEIGETIERTIRGAGFSPIVNLGGHGISLYNVHEGEFIPNVNQQNGKKLRMEGVVAVEPFSTTGNGYVIDSSSGEIFMFQSDRNVRDKTAREILEFIKSEYKTLPFSRRWVVEKYGRVANYALDVLTGNKALYRFPVLKEESGGNVSQFEHTFLFDRGEVTVTTL
ncbi:MAG: type II methionyl aminopeptidase [Candidatus Parvarchaeota archaeon]|nr:type II methionyl aminopeptidase [Candidatus Parvarchaeota archaeon]MCW1301825.1 type II methionyl aminopeptidase [Candidatus Parvarchaeota archaeon]